MLCKYRTTETVSLNSNVITLGKYLKTRNPIINVHMRSVWNENLEVRAHFLKSKHEYTVGKNEKYKWM